MGNIIVKGNTVTARFDDNVILTCTLRNALPHQSPSLERICIFTKNRRQVTFNAPHPNQRRRSQEPAGFVQLSSGWTTQGFSGRWRRVIDHVEQQPDNFPAAWAILRYGEQLLKQIENGDWPAPEGR